MFQVFAHTKGVFVRVFVQAFQQADALTGGQAVTVQERCSGLQGGAIFAVEDVNPIKTQGAVVGPLVTIQQQPVVQTQQQTKTRGIFCAKNCFRNNSCPR